MLHPVYLVCCVVVCTLFSTSAFAAGTSTRHDEPNGYYLSIPFKEMTSAQKTAARRAAKTQVIPPLVACAAPDNMPLSNKKAQGVENRILKLLAKKLDTTASFYWQSGNHRGMLNQLFEYLNCDLLLGVSTGSTRLLETIPIYRTTYVFVTRKDSDIHIKNFDDPALKTPKLGVVEPSAMRQMLARHGVKTGIEVMYQTDKQPWRLGQQVAGGALDIAALWGPFAGYANFRSGGKLKLQPANKMSNKIPMEYSVAIGMRPGAAVTKYALDDALKSSAKQIKAILEHYDIPLVQCSQCVVSGDLPSHGMYSQSIFPAVQDQFLKPADEVQTKLDRSKASKKIEQALKDGETATQQMFAAIDASQDKVVTLLVTKYHADPNALGMQGSLPLGVAASYSDSGMIKTLLSVGADPNLRDASGFTPLLYAAHLNHVPSINELMHAHANPDIRGPDDMTALGLAVGERHYFAAKALLEAGADVNAWSDKTHLTPLMLVASEVGSANRRAAVASGMEPVQLARMMIQKYHAKVTAKTTAGITALMVAAAQDNAPVVGLLLQHGAHLEARNDAGKTALDIAESLGADDAIQTLKLMKSMAPAQSGKAAGNATP